MEFSMRIFLVIIAIFALANASIGIGVVEKAQGRVKVKSDGSIKKHKVKKGSKIKYGDLIITSKKASAVIHLLDGSNLVLAPSSSIYFKSQTDAEQKSGKIYYKMASRDAKNALKIKTQFAIIGIKGTTFVIDSSKKGVSLKEGLIGVSSIEKEFNLYRKKVLDEFASYMAQEAAEFQKFQKDSGYEPPVKVKAFDLPAGKRLTFGADRVNEDDWNEEDDATFSVFESILSR
jgi:pyruvate/2-oxoglutarate dehydrogenase complex dihydrolipoamide acyltransferase (E2) component